MEEYIEGIELREHQTLTEVQQDKIRALGITLVETPYEGVPRYMGLLPTMRASYFVGVDWLDERIFIKVMPKLPNLDYMRMWASALRFRLPSKYLSKFYGMDFSKPYIEVSADNDLLTPILIMQFIRSIDLLLEHKLKSGYVARQENFHGRIKGRIIMGRQIAKNISQKRKLDVWCEYEEFSTDIMENRFLKRALLFSRRYLKSVWPASYRNVGGGIYLDLKRCLSAFDGVSDNVTFSEMKTLRLGKLFRHYEEPVRLANAILRRFGNTLDECRNDSVKVPPYWIDMSRLFEVYVYEKLYNAFGRQIDFQIGGYEGTILDFIKRDELLIIDSKYKPGYKNESDPSAIIHDVRQLSGYAHDVKIRNTMGVADNVVLNTVVIYPMVDGCENIDNTRPFMEQCEKVGGFINFWKFGVDIPLVATEKV